MKHWVRPKSAEQMLRLFPISGLVEDWYFRVEEVSAGVYFAEGSDTVGRTVSREGADPDVLLSECVADAVEIRALEARKAHGG